MRRLPGTQAGEEVNQNKNNTVAIISALIAFYLITIGDVSDIGKVWPGPSGNSSEIVQAFEKSLAKDLVEVAKVVDEKSQDQVNQGIANAFQRAADEADRVLLSQVEKLDDDDFDGLRKLLERTAEGLD